MKSVSRKQRIKPAILLLAAAAFVVALSGCQSLRRNQVAKEIAAESASQGISPIENLGSTDSLEILPLVEEAAVGPQYMAEHGVSYLVKTGSALILFDLGFNNVEPNQHSPLAHNMVRLGIRLDDIDTVVISHWHPDHVGGTAVWKQRTLSVGKEQPPLEGKRVCVPSPMNYHGITPVVSACPTKIAERVAVIGTLPFAEVMGDAGLPDRNFEQALAVNVAGRGVILIVGCGHPGVPKLVERAQAALGQPVVGVIGGLHLQGASEAVIQCDIDLLRSLDAQVVGLSPHDSDAAVIEQFRRAFPAAYQDVMVGQTIRL
jgi:7,8-dihydropterin-6-yl-methyl-4-(beta-D-ribofuranosyl)aminobenzene 5'-phosphate synthase